MPDDTGRFRRLWADEKAAAHLYRGLAALSDGDDRALFDELAATEERHAEHWAQLLHDAGVEPGRARLPLRTVVLLWLARRLGVARVLPAVIRAERSDRDRYRGVPQAPPAMAEDEAAHSRRLALAIAPTVAAGLAMAEGRHRAGAGGSLRAAVFGANDGLVSNFALIMGVAGGAQDASTVVLAGVAGLVAGAASMAAGEWISVRSQRELYEREIEIERLELEQFPDDEQRELELIYRSKGVDADTAAAMAAGIMKNPAAALDALVREELGLDPNDLGSPWVAAISSFVSFATGAAVPLVPFLLSSGTAALVIAAVLSGTALAAVGAAISVLTGRSAVGSAVRMVAIGGGAAAVTFAVGSLVGVTLG
ncbi:MAG TPA: VIT1/CCC1 family protein [Egibacteraceae bacterium]|nr:VIT1/CCC1 family protein [Egibacteraceae bacterium]